MLILSNIQGQGKLLVMEAKLADHSKLQDLQHKKVVSHVQLLSRTICYLRGQYTGAVPLQRQQRLGEAVRALINEKKDLSLKLAQVLLFIIQIINERISCFCTCLTFKGFSALCCFL